MPYAPLPPDGPVGDLILYPVDRLRAVGQQIISDAQEGLNRHNAAWASGPTSASKYADITPPDEDTIQPLHSDSGIQPVKMVLYPHERRLRASYEWQQAMGQMLLKLADQMDQMDQQTAQNIANIYPDPVRGPR
ncbi:MAG TPA: hypothetical protein VKY19_13390 [Ktedonosporobacter sp.]|jgi:hypothetical protein|nr:hypothetical protein [Ktedonosporobacter sp.]